jgi:hypothetical protein
LYLGKKEYIDGDSPICKFEHIIQCLTAAKPIEFDAIRREESGIEAGTLEDELIDEDMVSNGLKELRF